MSEKHPVFVEALSDLKNLPIAIQNNWADIKLYSADGLPSIGRTGLAEAVAGLGDGKSGCV